MNLRNLLSLLLALLFFQACGTPSYLKENAALIVFKTPTFKYADMGFIYENRNEVKAEIYGSGQALMSLKITGSSVCMSLLECMSKKSFNKTVLSSLYPNEILDNIFRGKPIFKEKNLKRNRNGFTQKLVKENKYDIHYSVLNNEIVFRDTINAILIKIKKQ
ncbi:MAG: hypothetical protein J7J02_09320 [Sulfurovum sp.]|nr:hypothetical protein [Sulfurovum sp.]